MQGLMVDDVLVRFVVMKEFLLTAIDEQREGVQSSGPTNDARWRSPAATALARIETDGKF